MPVVNGDDLLWVWLDPMSRNDVTEVAYFCGCETTFGKLGKKIVFEALPISFLNEQNGPASLGYKLKYHKKN